MKTKKKPEKQAYSLEQKSNAKRYYLLGLNLAEISKLIDAPIRTLEKWQQKDNWTADKDSKEIKSRVHQLYESGKSYDEIKDLLKISKTTIWRYLTTVREKELNQ